MVPARHTPPLIDAMGILAPLKMTTPCDSQPRRSVSSYIAASLIACPTSPTSPLLTSRSPEATQQAALDIVAGTGAMNTADERSLARARHASAGAGAQSTTYGGAPAINLPKDVAPPIREIRRLVKPCTNLVRIEWVGRGAAGVWDVTRSAAGKEPKVTFTPIDELYRECFSAANGANAGGKQAATDEEAEGAYEPQQEGDSQIAAYISSPIRRRVRGRTTTSLASSTFASLASFSSGRASSSDGSPVDPLTPPGLGRGTGLGFEGMSFGGAMRTSPTLSRRELPSFGGAPTAGVSRQGRSKSGDANLLSGIQEHGRISPEIVRKSGKSASVSAGSGNNGAESKMVRVVHGGG